MADFARNKKKLVTPAQISIESLEPRILFSADVFPSAIDGYTDPVADTFAELPVTVLPDSRGADRLELVVVDRSTPDYSQLVDDLLASQSKNINYRLHFIEPDENGINVITGILAQYESVDAVHIVSHGSEGQIQLGNASLDGGNVENHIDSLSRWGDALEESADLLFYGCDLTSDESGLSLITRIAQASGADVAASQDLTGSSAKGGDWDLESEIGLIDSTVPFSPLLQEDYSGLLAGTVLEWSIETRLEARGSVLITPSQLFATDADTDASGIIYTITTNTTNGYIAHASAPWPGGAVTTFTQQDINDFNLVYVNQSGGSDDYFDFEVSEGDSAAVEGTLGFIVEPEPDTPVSSGIELNVDGGNNAWLESDNFVESSLQGVSVELIISASATAQSVPVFTTFDGTNTTLKMEIDTTSGALSFGVGNGNLVSNAIDYRDILDDTLHSLAMTWSVEDGVWAVYVDGVLTDKGTGLNTGNSLDLSASRALLGNNPLSTGPDSVFSGSYYDVRLWDYERSEAEVNYLHNVKIQTPESRLIAAWQMDVAGSFNEVIDIVDNNPLSVSHHTGTGFVPSVVQQDLNVYENDPDGTVAGYLISHETAYPTAIAEDGNFTAAGTPTDSESYSANFGDWVVTAGQVEHWRADGVFADNTLLGGNAVKLTDANTSFGQTLPTRAGNLYQLNFSVAGDFSNGTVPVGLNVSVGNQTEDITVSHAAGWDKSNKLQWQHQSVLFAADGSSTTLGFSSQAGDALVADVRVIEIPLPVASVLASQPNMSYDAITNKFYKTLENRTTALGALNTAVKQTINNIGPNDTKISSRVVTVHSAYENARVHSLAAHFDDGIWLGGDDLSIEGEWYWNLGNGDSRHFWTGDQSGSAVGFSYANWLPMLEPNDFPHANSDGEDYVVMNPAGYWNDEPVTTGLNYTVYEWDAAEIIRDYELSAVIGSEFSVDALTGEVTVNVGTGFDHEMFPVLPLSATVGDAGVTTNVFDFGVEINNVNEAPTGVAQTITLKEDTFYDFSETDFAFTDIENNSLLSIFIQTLPVNGTLTLSTASVAAGQEILLADLPNLRYMPAPNGYGLGYDSLSFDVRDNDGTDHGGQDVSTNAAKITFNVDADSDVPTGTDSTVTLLEDNVYDFNGSDFGFDDVDGDTLSGVVIESLPASGILEFNSSPVIAGQVIPMDSMPGTQLQYIPVADEYGNAVATFEFTVVDNSGSNDVAITKNSIEIDILPVNDPPDGTDTTVVTIEDTTYDFHPGEFLYADVEGVSGGHNRATITVTSLPMTGVLTLSGTPVSTGDTINAGQIKNLQYHPPSGESGIGYASFTWLIQDTGGTANGGLDTDLFDATTTIDVLRINDEPQGRDSNLIVLEDTSYTFSSNDFGFTDTDADNLLAVEIVDLPAAGSLTLSGSPLVTGQVVASADISNLVFSPELNASGAAFAFVSFKVQDDGGTANGGSDTDSTLNTITIDVLSVNDSPEAINSTINVSENSSYYFTISDFGYTDIESDGLATVTIRSLPSVGNLFFNNNSVGVGQEINASQLENLRYQLGPANGSVGTSFNFEIQDTGGTANGGADTDPVANTITLNIGSVNLAPAGTDRTIPVYDGAGYTFSSADFGFSDPDSDTFSALEIASLPVNGDLALNGVLLAVDQIVSVGDLIGLTYTPVGNAVGTESFSFKVIDNGGVANGGTDTDATANVITFDLLSTNNAPSGTDATYSVNENGVHSFNVADFGFTDSDSHELATIKIASLPATGTLLYNNLAVSVNQAISAGSISNLEYRPGSNPGAAPGTSFDFQVQDNGGTAGSGIDTDQSSNTITFLINDVNNAPDGTDNTIQLNEDAIHIFDASDFGFNDVDSHNFVSVEISSLPVSGRLSLAGVDVTTGQVIDVTELSSLKYKPAENFHDGFSTFPLTTFLFKVMDDGGTANGGMDTDTTADSIQFSIASVNDAPEGIDSTLIVSEYTSYSFSAGDFGYTDVESDSRATVTITSLPSVGTLLLSGNPVTAGDVINAGQLVNLQYQLSSAGSTVNTGFNFRIQDAGGTANGGIDTDTTDNTITLNLLNVNLAPDGTDSTVQLIEDASYTFSTGDFGFTDPDSDAFSAVEITSLPGGGDLILSGAPVVAGQLVTAVDVSSLTFVPAADFNGIENFTFKVADTGGVANGGSDTDPVANVFNIDILSVNDAPSGMDATLSVDENGVHNFSAAEFGFSDSDLNIFASVKVVSLPSVGTLLYSGSPVAVNQSINADMIPNLEYQPGPNPTAVSSTSFDFRVQDTGGTVNGGIDTDPTRNTVTFNINDVNNAPQGSNNLLVVNEDTSHTFAAGEFGFSDQDGDGLAGVEIVTLPTAGGLTLFGDSVVAGQTISATDLSSLVFSPASNANGTAHSGFAFKVKDDGGTANGGSDTAPQNIIVFDVLSVNDAPEGLDLTLTVNEYSSYSFSAADFGYTDIESDNRATVTINYLPAVGALLISGSPVAAGDMINAGQLVNLEYQLGSAGSLTSAEFGFQIQDTGGTANGGIDLDSSANTITFNLLNVNLPPDSSDKKIQINEDASYTFSASDFDFNDPDLNTFAAVVITSIPQAGNLELNGSKVTAGQNIPVTELGGLVFVPDPDANGVNYSELSFQVKDDGGTANGGQNTDPSANTIGFDLQGINDAPDGANATLNLSEHNVYSFTDADFGFTDQDQNGFDALVIQTLPMSGSLTLSGVAVNAGQVIGVSNLSALQYQPPTVANGGGVTEFDFLVRDNGGTGNGGENTDPIANTLTININDVNRPPAGSNNIVQTTEDTGYRFSNEDFGFSDIDGNVLQSIHIASLPSNGALRLSGSAVSIGQVIQNTDLANLQFLPEADESGADYARFGFYVQDNGGVDNGGSDIDTAANEITINIIDVNDSPTGVDGIVNLIEDNNYIFDSADFNFTDIENNGLLGISVESLPSTGALSVAGTLLTAGEIVLAADIDAGEMIFVPEADSVGQSDFEFRVIDNGGSLNGGEDTDILNRKMFINISEVNDAPSGTSSQISLTEDVSYVFGVDDFGFTDVSDNDLFTGFTVGELPGDGQLDLNGQSVNTGDFINLGAIEATALKYIPSADASGAGNRVGFYVHDNGDALAGENTDPVQRFIELDITGVNDVPVFKPETATVDEGRAVALTSSELFVIDPDDDVQALNFTVSKVASHGELSSDGVVLTEGDTFTFADIGNNLVRYTHDGSETSVDSVQLSVSDESDVPVFGTLRFNILEVIDEPPQLNADNLKVLHGERYDSVAKTNDSTGVLDGVKSVLDNDDISSDEFIISLETQASNGVVELNPDGTFSYQHDGSENLTDSFSYRVTNSDGAFSVATVNVEVEPQIAAASAPVESSIPEIVFTQQPESSPEIVVEHNTEQEESSESRDSLSESQEKLEEAQQAQQEQSESIEASGAESAIGDAGVAALLDIDSELTQQAGDLVQVSAVQTTDTAFPSTKKFASVGSTHKEIGIKLHNGLDDITFQQAQSTSNFNSSFLIDIVVPVQSAREVIENRSFQKSLKQASEALEGPAKDQQRRIELGKDAAVGTSISVSVGALAWMLRGGAVLTAMLTTTPLWGSIDPLRVMSASSGKSSKEDSEVENMFED